jgi:hypothetical protein
MAKNEYATESYVNAAEAGAGCGMLGSIMATVITLYYTHNFWIVLLHAWLGWIYVIYRALLGLPPGM